MCGDYSGLASRKEAGAGLKFWVCPAHGNCGLCHRHEAYTGREARVSFIAVILRVRKSKRQAGFVDDIRRNMDEVCPLSQRKAEL